MEHVHSESKGTENLLRISLWFRYQEKVEKYSGDNDRLGLVVCLSGQPVFPGVVTQDVKDREFTSWQ